MLLHTSLLTWSALLLVALCQENVVAPSNTTKFPASKLAKTVFKDAIPTSIVETKDTTQEASTLPSATSDLSSHDKEHGQQSTEKTPTQGKATILEHAATLQPAEALAKSTEVSSTLQQELDTNTTPTTSTEEETTEMPDTNKSAAAEVVTSATSAPTNTAATQSAGADVTMTDASRDLDPFPPQLPKNYRVSLELWDGSRHFTVTEHKEDARLALTLTAKSGAKTPQSCLVNLTSGSGHVIRGVRCHVSTSLPHACFCSESQCAPYVRLASILAFIANGASGHDANRTTVQAAGVGAVEMLSWRRHDADMSVELTYVKSDGHELVPVSARLEGSGRVFGLPGGFVHLTYAVLSFQAVDGGPWNRANSPFLPPPGVFCQPVSQTARTPRLPALAEQFSVSMETIVHNARLISYEQQHYDLIEKLVAYTWRPHLHTPFPPVNFGNFPPAQSRLPAESFRIVHDFKSGVQYRISEDTGNCTLEGIPLDAPDAALTAATRHVRLRHAQELLHAERDSFAYWGMREIRGVLCDIWVASRGTQRGYYSTVEVFLSHKNWSVEMEVLNHVQRVPIGVATYLTPAQDSQGSSSFQHVATTHYFAYKTGHPAWTYFEIAPCLNRLNRLFLKLALQVTYRELAQFNLEAAQDSLRRAIAGIAGVSPLRVTQITLSSEGSNGEVAVWFSLLDAPGMVGPVDQPRAQLSLADAYQLLRGIVQRHPVPVRLGLGGGRQRVVQIRAGSLTSVPESVHPGGGGARPRRYLHATYTAGSMAGLGFSMVVLGLCLGLLSGFLLWKKRPSVPYELTE